MPIEKDSRSGEDRRDGAVSHKTLMRKLEEHDTLIARNETLNLRNLKINEVNTEKIEVMAEEISEINETLKPIAKGVSGMVWSLKAFLAIGAVAASATAIIVLVGHLNAMGDHKQATDFDMDVRHVQIGE